MRPLKCLNGAFTGTFSCVKVTVNVLLAASMPGAAAAPAATASTREDRVIISESNRVMGNLLPLAAPCQHAPERRIMIDEMVLECRRRVQHHHPQQRPGEIPVDLHQHFGEILV